MRDLNYFRTNQNNAPAWATKKQSYYQGINSNANMSINVGDEKVLSGNATVIIPDVGQPLNQTVIWGQKIQISGDKSYLVVDGTRIDLPAPQVQQCQTTGQGNTSVATQSIPLPTSSVNNSSQNPYSFNYSPPGTISSSIVSGIPLEGITFENIRTGNRLGPNGLEPYRSGTVQFKNGYIISYEDYESLTDAERAEYNEKPASDMLYN